MIIKTYNGEILEIPQRNIIFFDAQVHIKDKRYFINSMKLVICSNKDILWNDAPTEDMDFAERMVKYQDVRKITYQNITYDVAWQYDENNENAYQTTEIIDNVVTIKIRSKRWR